MASNAHIAEHLSGDTVAFVLQRRPDGMVDFDVVPTAESTWQVGQAMKVLLNGMRDFLGSPEQP